MIVHASVCGSNITITWICANFGFIVHTLCHYCELVATAAGKQSLKAFGGGLNDCSLKMRVQYLGMNKYIPSVSCISSIFTSWHCLLKSWSTVLAEHIQLQLWNQNSLSYEVWTQGGVD